MHDAAYTDSTFVERICEVSGREPNLKTWREFESLIPGRVVLEVGAGTGHLLAAAKATGRRVTAVETSPTHAEFIRKAWDISEVYLRLEDLPQNAVFDAIIAINVIEHVYEVGEFLQSLRRRLAPRGRILISTVNAEALMSFVPRLLWSMFKVDDHVSFASARGIRSAASSSDLIVHRTWSTEMPFETPAALAVAVRDYFAERHSRVGEGHSSPIQTQRDLGKPPVSRGGVMTSLRQWYSHAPPLDPLGRVLGRMGRAGSLKALLGPG